MQFKSLFNRKVTRTVFILLLTGMVAACSSTNTSNNGTSETKSKASKASKATKTISIGTTPVGVSYNSVGSGLASVISSNSTIRMSVKPFAGLSAWGPLLDTGELELGVASGPELNWALRGENGFQPIKNLRMLVRGNYIQVTGAVVKKDSGIKTVADLKGKKLSSDYPGSIIGKMVLEATLGANGLTWDDVQKVPIPTTLAGIEALQDNRVDAAFALTPTTPIIVEVHNAVGLYAVPFLDNTKPEDIDKVSEDVLKKINDLVPGSRMTKVAANGYIAQETVGIEYPAVMVASAHLSDDTVYEIMETLWANYEQLGPIHLWLKSWTPKTFFDPNPKVPYHPGAVKFFKEKGLWDENMEGIQQELLKLAS
jgi:TRAP transporter TAXI family solute receptor